MSDPRMLLEGLLFLQGDPVAPAQLGAWLGLADGAVEALVADLERHLDECGSALAVQRVAGGVRLATRPGLHAELAARLVERVPEPLSHASWEVLAIVAYRQPVTRLEVEAIRQTGSERALQTLVERGLVEEVGRKEAPGRPILYGTTPRFLQEFGLVSLSDLPPLPEPGEAPPG